MRFPFYLIEDKSAFWGNINTFKLEDLVGKTISIIEFSDDGNDIIAAYDVKDSSIYVLKVLIKMPGVK